MSKLSEFKMVLQEPLLLLNVRATIEHTLNHRIQCIVCTKLMNLANLKSPVTRKVAKDFLLKVIFGKFVKQEIAEYDKESFG